MCLAAEADAACVKAEAAVAVVAAAAVYPASDTAAAVNWANCGRWFYWMLAQQQPASGDDVPPGVP